MILRMSFDEAHVEHAVGLIEHQDLEPWKDPQNALLRKDRGAGREVAHQDIAGRCAGC